MVYLAKNIKIAFTIRRVQKVEEHVTVMRKEMEVKKILDPSGISGNGKYSI